MTQLVLYGTSACHLCELAEQLLVEVLIEYPELVVELVDIADDDALVDLYGTRIPVLERSDGRILCW
ncbi:MAG: glutaredoxin family protein, partial [Spongiibacter sp.]